MFKNRYNLVLEYSKL